MILSPFFPFKDLDADGLVVEDAHAVSTEVYVTCLGVLNHHEYCGAEVAPAVQLVKLG